MTTQPSPPPVTPPTKLIPQKNTTRYTVLGWVFMVLSLATFILPIVGLVFAVISMVLALKVKKTQDAQGRILSSLMLLSFDILLVVVGLFVTIGMLFVAPVRLF